MKFRAVVVSVFILLCSNTLFAYDIIEYFSKDVEDFKQYGEYVKESDRGKRFLNIVLVSHVHRDDAPDDRNKVIQSFHTIYDTLIKDRWMYENRQGQDVGTVRVEFVDDKVWTEIDIRGMERPYKIRNMNNFTERVIRKLNKEIRELGYTGIKNGVYTE